MIRVLTLNINYDLDRHGPWAVRSQLIQQVIEDNQPDVVALQAVRCAGDLDQAAQLSRMLPEYSHVYFQPAVEYEAGRADGSAILSRHPILSRDHLPLSVLPGQEDSSPRVLITALLDLQGERLRLFNAHFSWVAEQTGRNLDEALPFIRSYTEPALLAGDFNTQPDSGLLDRLREDGWVDAWQALHGENGGSGSKGSTFEAPHPTLRIDYVWASPAMAQRLSSIRILAAPENRSEARLSDHLGLLVVVS